MTPHETAHKIADRAHQLGWTYTVRGTILTITKQFQPGSNEELVTADMEYYDILCMLPRTSPGSDWGTDCGGIGAISALKSGVFTMNRSGGSKRVLAQLKKL